MPNNKIIRVLDQKNGLFLRVSVNGQITFNEPSSRGGII